MSLSRPTARIGSATALAVALAAALNGCSQLAEPDEGVLTIRESAAPEPVTHTNTEIVTVPASTSKPAPEAAVAEGFGTDLVEITDHKDGSYQVTGVRIGAHETFDRLVFDVGGTGTPWVYAKYDDNPSQPGSGFDVDVNGGAALRVLVRSVSDPYEDPDAPQGAAPSITDVVYQGVDEGDSSWYIGVDKKRPFKVEVLENPTRVVVDFQK